MSKVFDVLEANQNSYRSIAKCAETNLTILRALARALINMRAVFFCLRS